MKIIEPSFTLSTPHSCYLIPEDGIAMLRFIETQARISHRSEDLQTDDSWQRFIKAVVLDHGDYSVIEHCSITATLRVDRGITHELVRHRLFSFTQESTRFVNYAKKGEELEFIKPTALPDGSSESNWYWLQGIKTAEQEYLELLKQGLKPQEARSVLPNALAATIATTGNLRVWRAFFLSRVSKETHPDFRRITIPMLVEFQKIVPLLFEDIVPNTRQIDLARSPR